MKKARIIILIAIVLIGGIVSMRLWVNLQGRKDPPAPVVPDGRQNQMLKEIHFVEDKHGQKTWELRAKSVQVYQDENISVLEDVKVTYYAKEGRTFFLTSKTGKVNQQSKDVDLEGDVVLTTSDGYKLRTQSASYRDSEKMIRSSDPVDIEGDQVHITGKGMLVDVENKTFKILKEVKTELRREKKS